MKKRVLSMLMALALCLTLLPTAAFAEGTNGSAISSEAAAAEGGQPTATGAPTEGGGQLTNTGEGEQPNSETDALTEIWCVSKPDSMARSYDGTTNGNTILIDLTFTDGTNSIILKEGTDFTAKKTFDSADAGSRTVTVEIELIGDAAAKYKLKAGEETFTISGTINKAYPDLTVSLTKTTCTVGEKLLPLLFISGVQEDAAVTYYYTQYQTIVGNSEYEGYIIPAIDENTAVSSLDEEGNNTYYIYAKTGETVYIPFTIYARYGTTGTGPRQLTGTVAIKIGQTMNFIDVKTTDYFYNSVKWAVGKNITNGTSSTTFSPYKSCTRAEIVTFLWRAAGSPEPTTTRNPFRDVNAVTHSSYYKAIPWASQKGITSGTSTTAFSPDQVCTRAQIVTFLYRYAGQPSGYYSNPFKDVGATSEASYYTAICWAVGKGITSGTSATTFSPYASCNRAEAVTFLYRYTNGL